MLRRLPRTLLMFVALSCTSTTVRGEGPLPSSWAVADLKTDASRYGVEVARFESDMLASSTQLSLLNMGWRPVEVVAEGDFRLVVVGNTNRVGKAGYIAGELTAQKVSQGKIVKFPAGTSAAEVELAAPVVEPFLATPGMGPELPTIEKVIEKLQKSTAQSDDPDWTVLMANVDGLKSPDERTRGKAAAAIARGLHELHLEPDAVLFLAGKIARREWPAEDKERLACGEVVAELLYGQYRDARGAWLASETLLSDPARDARGRASDLLRLAAMEVEAASSGDGLRPTWNAVRARLRSAFDNCPEHEKRLQAKIELVMMQTFAWEGDWRRVEDMAHELMLRHATELAESSLARIYYARSLERTEEYELAKRQIELAMAVIEKLPQRDGLFMGYTRYDLRGEASRWHAYFSKLDLGADAEVATPTPAPTPTPEEGAGSAEEVKKPEGS